MFEIGSSLRQAREHRGLTVAEVERETRIRAKYLDALEEDRFHVLPGQAYVRGFLRTYAEFLGLNGNLYVDEYNARHAEPDEDAPPLQPHALAAPRQLHGTRRVASVLVALVAALVVVWQLGFTSSQRAPGAAPAGVAPSAKRTTAPRAQPRTVAPRRRAVAKPGGPATLVVRAARGDCWVAVHVGSQAGPVVYEQVLAQGGILRFGLAKPLWVRLGAPWNADVTLRGRALGGFPRQPVDLHAA